MAATTARAMASVKKQSLETPQLSARATGGSRSSPSSTSRTTASRRGAFSRAIAPPLPCSSFTRAGAPGAGRGAGRAGAGAISRVMMASEQHAASRTGLNVWVVFHRGATSQALTA